MSEPIPLPPKAGSPKSPKAGSPKSPKAGSPKAGSPALETKGVWPAIVVHTNLAAYMQSGITLANSFDDFVKVLETGETLSFLKRYGVGETLQYKKGGTEYPKLLANIKSHLKKILSGEQGQTIRFVMSENNDEWYDLIPYSLVHATRQVVFPQIPPLWFGVMSGERVEPYDQDLFNMWTGQKLTEEL